MDTSPVTLLVPLKMINFCDRKVCAPRENASKTAAHCYRAFYDHRTVEIPRQCPARAAVIFSFWTVTPVPVAKIPVGSSTVPSAISRPRPRA